MTTNDGPDVTRRQAIMAVVGVTGLLHGRMDSQRRLVLPLDGMDGILVQYNREQIFLPVAAIMAAIRGGKE